MGVKNLLSSEAICGDQITLKPFSAEAPPRTPSPESLCRVSVPKHADADVWLSDKEPTWRAEDCSADITAVILLLQYYCRRLTTPAVLPHPRYRPRGTTVRLYPFPR